ncbi:MAG: trigger factor, partial [Candidatus Atribacteria bacterium]|nr:trigger factor [Candidatus Atribacteria bacterium]
MVHIKKGEIEKNKVEVEVTVEQEQVEQAFKGIYRELSQKVKIPGFRSGRVP